MYFRAKFLKLGKTFSRSNAPKSTPFPLGTAGSWSNLLFGAELCCKCIVACHVYHLPPFSVILIFCIIMPLHITFVNIFNCPEHIRHRGLPSSPEVKINSLSHSLLGEGGGTRWRSWLRHSATSRKVAGSIPDGVTGIFHWHPSVRTMALGLTQPVTEMSTRNISWRVKTAGA